MSHVNPHLGRHRAAHPALNIPLFRQAVAKPHAAGRNVGDHMLGVFDSAAIGQDLDRLVVVTDCTFVQGRFDMAVGIGLPAACSSRQLRVELLESQPSVKGNAEKLTHELIGMAVLDQHAYLRLRYGSQTFEALCCCRRLCLLFRRDLFVALILSMHGNGLSVLRAGVKRCSDYSNHSRFSPQPIVQVGMACLSERERPG